jgi:hypothetical protein
MRAGHAFLGYLDAQRRGLLGDDAFLVRATRLSAAAMLLVLATLGGVRSSATSTRRCRSRCVVLELLATEAARDKLAARRISAAEVEQLPRDEHKTNPRGERAGQAEIARRPDGWPSRADAGNRADGGADDVAGRDRLERKRRRA